MDSRTEAIMELGEQRVKELEEGEIISPTVAAKGLSEGVQPVAGCPPFTLEGKHDASYCTH